MHEPIKYIDNAIYIQQKLYKVNKDNVAIHDFMHFLNVREADKLQVRTYNSQFQRNRWNYS